MGKVEDLLKGTKKSIFKFTGRELNFGKGFGSQVPSRDSRVEFTERETFGKGFGSQVPSRGSSSGRMNEKHEGPVV